MARLREPSYGPAYEVHAYAVSEDFLEDRTLGVKLGLMQEGSDAQLIIMLSKPLAWQIASRMLALTDAEPITPDDPEWENI